MFLQNKKKQNKLLLITEVCKAKADLEIFVLSSSPSM